MTLPAPRSRSSRRCSTSAREFAWLCVLIATDEAIARHHIAKVRQGGGPADEIATAIRLTAWAVQGPACTFIAEHRAQHLPDAPVAERDRADRTTSAGSVALRIAVPAAIATARAMSSVFKPAATARRMWMNPCTSRAAASSPAQTVSRSRGASTRWTRVRLS